MEGHRIAGYRIIEFSAECKDALWEIADCLIPHEQAILEEWVSRQCNVWEPPGLSRSDLQSVFAGILNDMLRCMHARELERCIDFLEAAGIQLAARNFPFEALVVSIHFLEESYMPLLDGCTKHNTQGLVILMDEFLHAAIASISTAYFETYRKELLDQAEVGQVVQEGLLANIPRKTADLDIAYVYKSAHESAQLGGDFLDFFTSDDGSSVFLIGDLAGHGLEAVSDSLMLRSLFRGFMRENPSLTEAMGRLNRVLIAELKSGLFATALAVSYQSPGRISLINAGHPYPIVCNGHAALFERDGFALALLEESTFHITDLDLEPGGVFVAYTDGLMEARNAQGELFGEERLVEIVGNMKEAPARAITETLVDKSLRHAGGKFSDDVAVLVLKRRAT